MKPVCNLTAHVISVLAFLFVYNGTTFAQQEERLTYDPQTGWYTMYYYSYVGPRVLQRVEFEMPNKINPIVRSKIKEKDKGLIRYEYKVKNSEISKQNFEGMRLNVSQAYEIGLSTPKGWYGAVSAFTDTTIVGWFYSSEKFGSGLHPGHTQNGFGYESRDLPGVGFVETRGDAKPSPKEYSFPDEGPLPDTEIGKQYRDLIQREQYVRLPGALPRIAVPTPFDAAAVLSGIQKHLNQDLVSMKLVDPVFASQLDRLLQTAVQAAKQGNTQGLRSNIQDLRRLLRREHEHVDKEDTDKDDVWDDDKDKPKPKLIDKLAAKVLDFDLKYVLKRVGEKS